MLYLIERRYAMDAVKNYFKLLSYLKVKKQLLYMIAISFLAGIFAIIPIYAMQYSIDTATSLNNNKIEGILFYGIVYLITQVMASFLTAYKNIYSEFLQMRLCRNLQIRIYNKFTTIDYMTLNTKDKTNINNSIIEDCNYISENSLIPLSKLVFCVVSFTFTLYYMVNVNVILTSLLFPLLIITALLSHKIQKDMSYKIKDKRESNEKVWKIFSEVIECISVIRLFDIVDLFEKKLHDQSEQAQISGMSQSRLEAFSNFALSALFMVTIGLIMILSAFFLIHSTISIGAMVAILMYNQMLVDPLLEIVNIQSILNKVNYSFIRISNILEASDKEHRFDSTYIPEEIVFDNVKYQYPGRNRIFEYNFKIKKGEKISIFGETGSGKSTIAKLMSHLIYPISGSVDFLDSSNNHRLPPYIAFQEQECFLFDDTVMNNITLWNKKHKNIRKIVKYCFLENLIDKLDEETIGENGSKISGGERKRIAIARTLLFDEASILIFDELCSSLDINTAESIVKFIVEEFSDKTIIFIEHNSLINNFVDKTIYVD